MPRTPRLREWRDRATLTQEELAEVSGVSRPTIAELERGGRGGQPSTIRKLARALGCEPQDFYGEELTAPKAGAPQSERGSSEAPKNYQVTLHTTSEGKASIKRHISIRITHLVEQWAAQEIDDLTFEGELLELADQLRE